MTLTQPLTAEQRRFAEDNHGLVYSFLNGRNLSEDMYDIVVFGYLRAVVNYFEREELRRYSFTTIAKWGMTSDLYNHYRKQYRLKRKAYVISLDTPIDANKRLTLIDVISVANRDYSSLLDEISAVLHEEQFNIVQMKAEGYTDREISKHYDIPVHSIQEMLSSIKDKVYTSLV